MSFSTQRDFLKYPSPSEGDRDSDEDSQDDSQQETSPRSQKLTESHSTFQRNFSPELSNILSRLNGSNARLKSAWAQNQRKHVQIPTDVDSGILSDRYATNTYDARNLRYNESDDLKSALRNTSEADNFESLLKSLQNEGKFTIEAIMSLLKKYTATITEMMGENRFMKSIQQLLPDGTYETTIEFIQQQVNAIIQLIAKLNVPPKVISDLKGLVDGLMAALKKLLCEKDRESISMINELEKVSMDRRNLKDSLAKLTNVEGKILDLKNQAAMSNTLQKDIHDLKEQLEESTNHNKALCDCLTEVKKGRSECEEKCKKEIDKTWSELTKWKCKAELLTDIHHRGMLELEKWKIHCSRITIELDKATDRILRTHETKRKLYYAESMRSELENQIEEMMEVIKELNEKKNSPGEPNTASPKCQRVLANLLAQSKNTLQNILSNVNAQVPAATADPDGKYKAEIKRFRDENARLKRENIRLKKSVKRKSNNPTGTDTQDIKALEASLKKTENELQKCQESELRAKQECARLRNARSSDDLDILESLKNKLKECQDENRRRLKNTVPIEEYEQLKEKSAELSQYLEAFEEAQRLCNPQTAIKLQELNDSLNTQLQEYQNEIKGLKQMIRMKSSESHESIPQTEQVVIVDLHSPSDSQGTPATDNFSTETQKSQEAGHTREVVFVGPETDSEGPQGLDSKQECVCARNEKCREHKHFPRPEKAEKQSHNTIQSYSTSFSELSKPTLEARSSTIDDPQEILSAKEQTIRQLEEEVSVLRECISTLENNNLKIALVKNQFSNPVESIAILENEVTKFKEELNEQNSLLLLAKDQLKTQRNEIRKSKELLTSLQEKNSELSSENRRLQEEKSARDAVKTEKNRLNGNLRNQDNDCDELQLELINSRVDAERYRQEFNEKVRSMLEEKSKLESENKRLTKELEDLDEVVDEVGLERTKNRKLEDLINELEMKIQDMSKPQSDSKTLNQGTAHYFELVEKLKKQVEAELNANNQLRENINTQQRKIETMSKLIAKKDMELQQKAQGRSLVPFGATPSNAGNERFNLQAVNMPDEYVAIITELRNQLNAEKTRYHSLQTKFVLYSIKVEELEKKLRQKRAVLEKEIRNMPDLQEASSRVPQSAPTSESIETMENDSGDSSTNFLLKNDLKVEKEKLKKIRARLVIEFIKNETLSNRFIRCRDHCEELQIEIDSKESYINYLKNKLKQRPKLKNESIQLQLQQFEDDIVQKFSRSDSENDGSSPDDQLHSSELGLLQVANDYHEVSDQLKEQLRAEKEKNRQLRSKTIADGFTIDDLQTKLKISQEQIDQLVKTISSREAHIENLHRDVRELSKAGFTDLKERSVQTDAAIRPTLVSVGIGSDLETTRSHTSQQHTITNLQSQLDDQVKKNFDLTSDFSKEITNAETLKNELKRAEREIRKLCKCIKEVEQQNDQLQQRNRKLEVQVNENEQLMNLNKSETARQKTPCSAKCANKPCRNKKCGSWFSKPETQAPTILHDRPGCSGKCANLACLNPNCGGGIRNLPVPPEKKDAEVQNANNDGPRPVGNRLQRICSKVQENGIESLNIRDLTYLHREVYNAGRKIKNSDSESAQEKCLEFIANLPPIPTNKEEKIIARVSYLESELDSANQVLQHLKKEYEKDERIEERDRHRGGETRIPPQKLDRNIFKLVKEHNRN